MISQNHINQTMKSSASLAVSNIKVADTIKKYIHALDEKIINSNHYKIVSTIYHPIS